MNVLYYLPLALFLIACSPTAEVKPTVDRFTHIKDDKARELIKLSINNAGGIEKWESIKQLNYTKNFSLLLESGEVEKEFHQVHNYKYAPPLIDIKSLEDGKLIQTILKDGQYRRTIDEEPLAISQEKLAKAINTSLYVIGMPFKLLDPGAKIKYLGQDSLADGKQVEVLMVSYNDSKYKNHSSSEIWKYYFDTQDGKIVANWVKSSDHISWIENISYQTVDGILFNKERKSYRIDSLGNKLFLRANYLYDNYELN